MSPRRNRPTRSRRQPPAPLDQEQVRRGVGAVESWGGQPWRVHHIPGTAATKTYRCPGCDQEIAPGVPHVVAWPVESLPGGAGGIGAAGGGERRHWHAACWRARDRRRPIR